MGAYRHITVQIPYGMYRALKDRSVKREISYSSIIRKLLEVYLDKREGRKNEKI
jgi:metal-responsive CopG/Arc/MetJ family transcriptional regulator